MVGIGTEFGTLAGLKIHHIGAFRGALMAQHILGLGNGLGIEAKGLVALLAAGNGLENKVTGRALFHRFHLGGHMGQHANLGGNFPMFLDLLEPAQHLAYLLRGVGDRIQTDHRVTGAKTQTLQHGGGDAVRIIGSVVGLQAAGKGPRQADGGVAVGSNR